MTGQPVSSTPPPIILLVEDDLDTREMYHLVLESDGYWVVDAPDVTDAVTTTEEILPDLIVTDLGLPGERDGVNFAEELRSNPRTAEIPVLALTGRDPAAVSGSGTLFTDVLLKPIPPDVLLARIRGALADSRQLKDRGVRARGRVSDPRERSGRTLAHSHRIPSSWTGAEQSRSCPRCGKELSWSERRTVYGVVFDYYQPCQSGCGSFCYNHSDHSMTSLEE